MLTLEAKKRATTETRAQLKKSGSIPAVFYGRKEKSTPIALPLKEFLKVWKSVGESSIITIKADGEEHQALIQEVSRDPLTEVPVHADFYVIEKDKKLKLKVPIEFSGTAPAIKDLGGTLVKVLHELEIEALPKDLPHVITVDIAPLTDLKSQILAKNISMPKGVELVTKAHEVVAALSEPKEEKEEVPATIDFSAIEVEKKGKETKEGEEGGEATLGAASAVESKEVKKEARKEGKKEGK